MIYWDTAQWLYPPWESTPASRVEGPERWPLGHQVLISAFQVIVVYLKCMRSFKDTDYSTWTWIVSPYWIQVMYFKVVHFCSPYLFQFRNDDDHQQNSSPNTPLLLSSWCQDNSKGIWMNRRSQHNELYPHVMFTQVPTLLRFCDHCNNV